MRAFLLAVLSAAVSGLQLASPFAPASRVRSTVPVLSESDKKEPKGLEVGPLGELPILTLEERGDGWDDVRREIIKAKKERAPAIDELKRWNDDYLAPAARWTKVIAEEITGAELTAPKLDVSAPKLSAPKLSAPKLSAPNLSVPKAKNVDKKAVTKSAVKSVAKVVGGLPAKKKVSTKKKGSGKKPAPAAVGNVFLLLGVPALSLLAVAYVGLPIFFP